MIIFNNIKISQTKYQQNKLNEYYRVPITELCKNYSKIFIRLFYY